MVHCLYWKKKMINTEKRWHWSQSISCVPNSNFSMWLSSSLKDFLRSDLGVWRSIWLHEYSTFVKNQQAQGSDCPILFLQEEADVQGNDVYRVRPSPFDLQGGMDPLDAKDEICRINAKEFNSKGRHGFDPTGQGQGIFDILDVIHKSTSWFLNENAEFILNSGGLSTLMDELVLGMLLIARCCSAPSSYFIYQHTSL